MGDLLSVSKRREGGDWEIYDILSEMIKTHDDGVYGNDDGDVDN